MQGSREYSQQQIVDQLGLGSKMAARKGGPGQGQQMAPAQAAPGGRFIQPISDCEFTINAALDELLQDAFPRLSEHRPNRCTGTAVQVRGAIQALPGARFACWHRAHAAALLYFWDKAWRLECMETLESHAAWTSMTRSQADAGALPARGNLQRCGTSLHRRLLLRGQMLSV